MKFSKSTLFGCLVFISILILCQPANARRVKGEQLNSSNLEDGSQALEDLSGLNLAELDQNMIVDVANGLVKRLDDTRLSGYVRGGILILISKAIPFIEDQTIRDDLGGAIVGKTTSIDAEAASIELSTGIATTAVWALSENLQYFSDQVRQDVLVRLITNIEEFSQCRATRYVNAVQDVITRKFASMSEQVQTKIIEALNSVIKTEHKSVDNEAFNILADTLEQIAPR